MASRTTGPAPKAPHGWLQQMAARRATDASSFSGTLTSQKGRASKLPTITALQALSCPAHLHNSRIAMNSPVRFNSNRSPPERIQNSSASPIFTTGAALDTAPTSAQYESLTMAITVGPCQTSDGSFRTAPVIKGVHFSVPFRWLGTAAPAPRRFRALIRLTLMSFGHQVDISDEKWTRSLRNYIFCVCRHPRFVSCHP
jgi:hypothetical protein